MINEKAEEVIEEVMEEPFESFLSKHQIRLETRMKDSDFFFDCIHLLYYKCCKINLNQSGSNVDSPCWSNWMKNKSNNKSH